MSKKSLERPRERSGEPGSDELRERFNALKEEWWKTCRWLSVREQITRHPSHRAIVAMGESAIPLILRDMRASPKHWCWTLEEITGQNPAPEERRGDFSLMREDWLRWGEAKGYID